MADIVDEYDFRTIEERWRRRWEDDHLWSFDIDTTDRQEKFYNLVEFPYPSAEGLHVGHVYTYCGADTYGRYLRMKGKKVFQPMGFDSFGIHTENYAIRVNENPMILTVRTMARYKEQLDRIGVAWNWEHGVVASDPSYYRWTQWLFLKLYHAGLAVRKEAPVVWCPSCMTVLAYEQVEGDRCERCNSRVVQRVMKQWFLRITACADDLLDNLNQLDWPEVSKTLQRDWIGRSQGVDIDFPLKGSDSYVITVFTSRPDTLFGVTYVAVAPGHPKVSQLASDDQHAAEIAEFVQEARDEAAVTRYSIVGQLPKRGVFTGTYAIHPLTGAELPVYVADYVLEDYGTGAIMGVPAHDDRDYEFAAALGLETIRVIVDDADSPLPWMGAGRLINSEGFSEHLSSEARAQIARRLESNGSGRMVTRYRMHDWLISRQRYWGPPIPIIYCDQCGMVAVPEEQLPVVLPYVEDFHPTGTGKSPLAAVDDFVNTTCPSCGGPAKRETDVSDTFLDSSWYYLRYPSNQVHDKPWDPVRTERMLPVDQYAGGIEHVTRHHLYSRFVIRALRDLGHVGFDEPFPRLRLHGLLIKDGSKMSKSRGNVVVPDKYIDRVGADNLRTYLLFCGPWEAGGDFSDKGLMGIVRLTAKVWRTITGPHQPGAGIGDLRIVDRTIVGMEDSLTRFKFNTGISKLMVLVRWASNEKARMTAAEWRRVSETIVLLLAPYAPHLAEELWSRIGGPYSVHQQPWPAYDPQAIEASSVTLVVQVNGKVRDRLTVPAGTQEDEAKRLALSSDRVLHHLSGNEPAGFVFVPDRLLNVVVGRT